MELIKLNKKTMPKQSLSVPFLSVHNNGTLHISQYIILSLNLTIGMRSAVAFSEEKRAYYLYFSDDTDDFPLRKYGRGLMFSCKALTLRLMGHFRQSFKEKRSFRISVDMNQPVEVKGTTYYNLSRSPKSRRG